MRDYTRCEDNRDGIHGPIKDSYEQDAPAGYATVECAACGLHTSIPIPPVSELEWE